MNPRAIKKRAHYFDWAGFGTSPRIGVCVRFPTRNYAAARAILDESQIDYYGELCLPDYDAPGWTCLFLWQKKLYNRPNRFLSSLSRATRTHGLRILRGRGPY